VARLGHTFFYIVNANRNIEIKLQSMLF